MHTVRVLLVCVSIHCCFTTSVFKHLRVCLCLSVSNFFKDGVTYPHSLKLPYMWGYYRFFLVFWQLNLLEEWQLKNLDVHTQQSSVIGCLYWLSMPLPVIPRGSPHRRWRKWTAGPLAVTDGEVPDSLVPVAGNLLARSHTPSQIGGDRTWARRWSGRAPQTTCTVESCILATCSRSRTVCTDVPLPGCSPIARARVGETPSCTGMTTPVIKHQGQRSESRHRITGLPQGSVFHTVLWYPTATLSSSLSTSLTIHWAVVTAVIWLH